jgi:hypothetical protein
MIKMADIPVAPSWYTLSHKPSWHGQGNLYLYLPSIIIDFLSDSLFISSQRLLLLLLLLLLDDTTFKCGTSTP